MEEPFGEQHVERRAARIVSDAPKPTHLILGELQARHGCVLIPDSFHESRCREHERLLRITSERPSAGEATSITHWLCGRWLAIADDSRNDDWAESLTQFIGSFDRVEFGLQLSDPAELDIQVASNGANFEAELIDDGSQSSVRSSLFQEPCAHVLGGRSAPWHMDESP
jgi:hypothetical protein